MALQTTGAISLGDVNVELGNARTATINMGSSAVRGLFDRASGECKLAFHGRGKSNTTQLTIAANTNNYDIGAAVLAAGGDKATNVQLTINSGVTVGSTSSSTAAMYTGTGWGSGVTINITNNGSIVGASGSNTSSASGNGGNGGNGIAGTGGSGSSGTNGTGSAGSTNNGGNAFEHSQTADNNLSVIFNTVGTRTGGSAGTHTANGGGGGGGAGNGCCYQYCCGVSGGGGGGGGGATPGNGGSVNGWCSDGNNYGGYVGSSGSGCSGGSGGNGKSGSAAGWSGAGGDGGDCGSAGSSGQHRSNYCSHYRYAGSGGSAGTNSTYNGSAGSVLSGNTGQIS